MQTDIVVLIPKRDEYRCTLAVFGLVDRVDDLPTLEGSDMPYGIVSVADLSVALVLLNGQGNVQSARATMLVRDQFKPTHVFLVGTAAGNGRRTHMGM